MCEGGAIEWWRWWKWFNELTAWVWDGWDLRVEGDGGDGVFEGYVGGSVVETTADLCEASEMRVLRWGVDDEGEASAVRGFWGSFWGYGAAVRGWRWVACGGGLREAMKGFDDESERGDFWECSERVTDLRRVERVCEIFFLSFMEERIQCTQFL